MKVLDFLDKRENCIHATHTHTCTHIHTHTNTCTETAFMESLFSNLGHIFSRLSTPRLGGLQDTSNCIFLPCWFCSEHSLLLYLSQPQGVIKNFYSSVSLYLPQVRSMRERARQADAQPAIRVWGWWGEENEMGIPVMVQYMSPACFAGFHLLN